MQDKKKSLFSKIEWRNVWFVHLYFLAMVLSAYWFEEYGKQHPDIAFVISLYFVFIAIVVMYRFINTEVSSLLEEKEDCKPKEGEIAVEVLLDNELQKELIRYCCEENITMGEAIKQAVIAYSASLDLKEEK